MKFVCSFTFIVLLISAIHANNDETSVNIAEKGILLRKLLDDKQESTSNTWNDMLAKIIVNKIKGTSNSKLNEETNEANERDGILITLFSKTLFLYKYYVYDKLVNVPDDNNLNIVDPVEPEDWTGDPNKEVEIFDPKSEENCTTCGDDGCPEGSRKNGEGKCIAPLIISVPYHCPRGYVRDRWGKCRLIFNF